MNDSSIPAALPRRTFLTAALGLPLAAEALLNSGCAKVPVLPTSNTQKLLHVTFSMRSAITTVNPLSGRPNYYFIVVNLVDDPNAPGPVPQIAPPFSNGIAVSNPSQTDAVGMVGFVQYGGGVTDAPHLFRAPRDLTNTTALAYKNASITLLPEYTDLGSLSTGTVSGQTIDATFDLNRLLLDPVTGFPTPTLPAYVQVNIITTDNVPSGSATDQPKYVDAIGDGRNSSTKNIYVTLPTAQSGQSVLSTTAGSIFEPTDSDVVDRGSTFVTSNTFNETLDIISWQIQLQ